MSEVPEMLDFLRGLYPEVIHLRKVNAKQSDLILAQNKLIATLKRNVTLLEGLVEAMINDVDNAVQRKP